MNKQSAEMAQEMYIANKGWLEIAHPGKYVAFNTVTGKYQVGNDHADTVAKCIENGWRDANGAVEGVGFAIPWEQGFPEFRWVAAKLEDTFLFWHYQNKARRRRLAAKARQSAMHRA